MPSDVETSWSGSLKSKKKSELQQICRQLSIEYRPESLKADLEQQIRHRFQEVPGLQEDDRFIKLDHPSSPSTNSTTSNPTSRRGARARSISRPTRANDAEQSSSAEDTRTRSGPSPSRRTTRDPNAAAPPSSETPQILVTVVNTDKDGSRHTPTKTKAAPNPPLTEPQLPVKEIRQQAIETLDAAACCTSRQAINVIQTIQNTFSCPWKLCVIAILAELTFVLYSTVPLRQGIYVSPTSDGSPITIPEPVIRLFHRIFSKSFMKPFLGYIGLTVIAPFIIGGLMNVPSPNQEKDNQPKFKASRDLKPSVFVYCAARLAMLSLVHLVFYPNYHFGWAYPKLSSLPPIHPSPLIAVDAPLSKHLARNIQLTGFENLQYVTTAFAMLIALHQTIRSSA
ncbi:hypothetical protein KEM48_013914 [Puccinia striiformis f. sp. tritici PST-130]|nr:hypothetical protein Pst134EB_018118 [Puccinia striiformis f. sp. tritici]KAI9630418.1 hypothetical protein KEM48_013914 [Puccinia striiformis f. sp. tritici PST-130]